jgi:hypothetical protein
MRNDQNIAAGRKRRRNATTPAGLDPGERVLQRLGRRQHVRWHIAVTCIEFRVARIICSKRRRRDIVAAPPDLDLLGAEFVGRCCLVETLQGAVMTFIQAPVALNRDPHAIHFVQHQPERADCPLQHGCECQVEFITLFAKQLACGLCFGTTLPSQVDIGPTREQIFQIPGALTMTDQDELAGHGGTPAQKTGGVISQ